MRIEHGDSDDMFNSFDEDFFNMCFEGKPMEAVRAAYFGKIDWNDEYIRFDAYGNLESFNSFSVNEIIEYEIEEIFEHPDIWEDYIEEEEYPFCLIVIMLIVELPPSHHPCQSYTDVVHGLWFGGSFSLTPHN